MQKLWILTLVFLLGLTSHINAEEIIGFWKTVNEKTKQPESIVAIYEYQGKYYGRLIGTYDKFGNVTDTIDRPKGRAPGVEGHPFYAGLDFMWDLKKEGGKYSDGKILDPEEGKIYDAEMWTDQGNLIVRGEILIFGRNQTWPPAKDKDFPPDFRKPDLTTLIPKIPKVLEKSL